MRWLMVVVILVCLASACLAGYSGYNPENDPLDSPEVHAARTRARGEERAARTIAAQMESNTEEREQTIRTVAIVFGVIVCTAILGYSIARRSRPVQ